MADQKDRRTNMATSSVNAQPAKGGAGAYSWGSPTDVKDFEPAGVDMSKVGVQIVPQVQVVQQAPAVVYSHDDSAFPALGASDVTRVAATNWAPGTVYAAAPTSVSIQPAPCVVRSIGTEFGPSHPRNQFATLPTKTVSSTVVQAAPVVDWSASGGLPVASQLIRAGGGAAHVSPLFLESKPAQQVPLTVLRAQTANAPVYAPTVARPVKSAPK